MSAKNSINDWMNKINESISYLSEKEMNLSSHMSDLNHEKNLMQQLHLELEKTLKTIQESSDPNRNLFYPIDEKVFVNEEKRTKDRLFDVEQKLPVILEEYQKLSQEKNNLINIKECLKEFYLQQKNMLKISLGDENNRKIEQDREGIFSEKEEIGLKILETQEIERKRIARDLHDSTIQSMTNLVHKAELCTKLLDIDIMRSRMELLSMSDSIRLIINEMRAIIYNLQPMALVDLGLLVTIERFIDSLNKNKTLDIVFQVHGKEKNINSVMSLSIYRIIQEACSNAVRHSNATEILVDLSYFDEEIEIRINDNGDGFDLEESIKTANEEGHGYGLSIMKERVFLLSGKLEIDSIFDKGTKIYIKLPIVIGKSIPIKIMP